MPIASNAKLQLEAGQTLTAYALMTDAGDRTNFTSAASVWSGKSGFEPSVRPNGIVSGVNLVTAAADGSNNNVDVAAFTAYSIGVLNTVSAAANTAITRPATNISRISSITMTSAGAIAVVAGVDGATTAFSEVRGAAGGPPLIPVDSVEVAQVRIAASAAAPITAAQIFQVVGQHAERYDFPTWNENNIGLGSNSTVAAKKNAHISYDSALPSSHTGAIAKRTYIQYYVPTLADASRTLDFVPVENSHSVSSTQYYGGTIASSASSIGQGSFTALLNDGVADSLVNNKDQVLTVKFFPDRNKTAYVLTQGKIGLARTFPVADQIQASVTISAQNISSEFVS